ncbi:MAG: hypothetical protein HOM96_04195 [Rickettsiales bacterium]|jgi:hypothetical protein|nr:hypothetical protein [Rickettsiales bacterium]
MDLFDEVKQEVERDKLRSMFAKYYKHIISVLILFVIIVVGLLLYHNYKKSLMINSYINYTENTASGFENKIVLTNSPNAVDIIHFVNKFSYLSSSGDNEAALNLLKSLNYNNIAYQPFREILFLYDDNREGNNSLSNSSIFKSESQFIAAINLIKKNDLQAAYNSLNNLTEEPSLPELLRNKAIELKKIVQFKLNEKSS